jgi:predicted MFS family arabinose efflux permease
VAILFGAAALNYSDRTAITAVFPLLSRDLGMSDIALGATGTVFLWSYAIVSPLAGYMGDRISRARLLTFSLAAWSLVMLASAFATGATELLVMRALLGIPEAAYIPAATALIADHHGPETRAKAIGIHIAGFSFGMVAGGWLAGYMGEHFGWRPSFAILGIAGLLLSGVAHAFLRDGSQPQARVTAPPHSMASALREMARVPSFLVLTAEIVLSGTVSWVFINWLPLYFKETFSLSLAMAGLYGSLWIQGGRVLGLLAGGPPSDLAARRSPRHRMLVMVVCYLAAAPILLTFTLAPAFWVTAASIFAFAFFVGMGYVNAQPLLCELLPVHLRSTAIGVMNMSACFAGGAGVLLAGALKSDVGLARSFASLGVVVAGVALMLLITYRTVLPKDVEKARLGHSHVAEQL